MLRDKLCHCVNPCKPPASPGLHSCKRNLTVLLKAEKKHLALLPAVSYRLSGKHLRSSPAHSVSPPTAGSAHSAHQDGTILTCHSTGKNGPHRAKMRCVPGMLRVNQPGYSWLRYSLSLLSPWVVQPCRCCTAALLCCAAAWAITARPGRAQTPLLLCPSTAHRAVSTCANSGPPPTCM